MKTSSSFPFLALLFLAVAADQGVNEPWTMQYVLQTNASMCTACPSNEQPRSLDEIKCRLHDLVTQQRVRTFREILPFQLLQPARDFQDPMNARARELTFRVISLYEASNVSLILAFDRPLAAWMVGSESYTWCPIPPLDDAEGWTKLKDALSDAIAGFLGWLAAPAASGGAGLDPVWLHAKLLLEPWNEFDAVADTDCNFPSEAPSATRAASLQKGVTTALMATGAFTAATLPIQITPSVSAAQGSWSGYMSAYYAAGGTGLPSIHWCE